MSYPAVITEPVAVTVIEPADFDGYQKNSPGAGWALVEYKTLNKGIVRRWVRADRLAGVNQ